MTTALPAPDLLAAAEAADRSATWHERIAAGHLLPLGGRLTGRLWPPAPELATACAELARADRLEARQLLAEHRAARAER